MGRRYTRGTEYEGTPELVAPGQSIPAIPPRGLANKGGGTTSTVIPQKRHSQQWEVVGNGITSNASGHPITILDVSTVNSNFQGLAYTFPNDDLTDSNSWTIDIALPTFMAAEPKMKIRLFIICTGTGAC